MVPTAHLLLLISTPRFSFPSLSLSLFFPLQYVPRHPQLSIATLLSAHVLAPGRSTAQHGPTPGGGREEGGEQEGEGGDAPRHTPRLLSPEEVMTFCTAPADVSVKAVGGWGERVVAASRWVLPNQGVHPRLFWSPHTHSHFRPTLAPSLPLTPHPCRLPG